MSLSGDQCLCVCVNISSSYEGTVKSGWGLIYLNTFFVVVVIIIVIIIIVIETGSLCITLTGPDLLLDQDGLELSEIPSALSPSWWEVCAIMHALQTL